MVENHTSWLERMERAQQKLQERILKAHKETWEQLVKLMEMMANMMKRKRVAESPNAREELIP